MAACGEIGDASCLCGELGLYGIELDVEAGSL